MTKPIVCPECILLHEKTQAEKPDDSDEELSEGNSIKTFNNWKAYAYHILTAHPNSNRVNWVISSVSTEQERYRLENKDIPASTKTLLELINRPQVLNETDNKTNEDEQPILIDEKDWKERLAELHGLSEAEKIIVEPKPKKRWSLFPNLNTNKVKTPKIVATKTPDNRITIEPKMESITPKTEPVTPIEIKGKQKNKNPISQVLYDVFKKPL